jgi:hypothetical protein
MRRSALLWMTALSVVLFALLPLQAYADEAEGSGDAGYSVPPPPEGWLPGPRALYGYEQVREMVPYVLPESPVLQDARPTSPFNAGPMDEAMGDSIPRQNPDGYSPAEMMLAYGWKNPKAVGYWGLPYDERLHFDFKGTEDTRDWAFPYFNPAWTTVELWWWVLNNMTLDADTASELFDNSAVGTRFDDPEGRFIEDYLAQYTSPVTGKLLKFKCREFSPGNMYITFIPDEVVEQYRDFFAGHWEQHVKPEPENIVYMYYRVYGTTGVIRSGIFFGVPNHQGFLLGRS